MKQNKTFLENLKYGNLTFEQEEELKINESVFNKYVDIFKNEPYPNVDETITEIDNLKSLINSKTESENWNEVKNLINHVDSKSFDVIEMYVKELGIDFKSDYLKKVQIKLTPFILSLKKYYNRPRPYQFSYYTNQNLHPFKSKTAHTPSYPSGHATQGYLLGMFYSKRYPNHRKEFMKLGEDIAESRVNGKAHYPSDKKAGIDLAEKLFDNLI